MINTLDRLVDDIAGMQSKLILLIGPPRSGKSDLLGKLSARRQAKMLNVGAVLGRELLTIPNTRRHLQAADLLKGITENVAEDGLLLMDNIEILFDQTLHISPLDLLKRHAQARRVVSVWPGERRENRLSYAAIGHPEHQDYGIDGLVPFEIK